MDYQKTYNDTIYRIQNQFRKRLKKTNTDYVYYEEHHIIPRCFFKSAGGHLDGDKDDTDNLVLLTPEEHFDAHQLLALIYPEHLGLLSTAIMMTSENNICREEFGILKRKFSEDQSNRMLGENNPFYGKHFNKSGENNAMFGRKGSNHPKFSFKESEETKQKKRKPKSKEHIAKVVTWHTGRKRPKETGQNISKAKKGKKTGPQKNKRGPWSTEEKLKRSKPVKRIICNKCNKDVAINRLSRHNCC